MVTRYVSAFRNTLGRLYASAFRNSLGFKCFGFPQRYCFGFPQRGVSAFRNGILFFEDCLVCVERDSIPPEKVVSWQIEPAVCGAAAQLGQAPVRGQAVAIDPKIAGARLHNEAEVLQLLEPTNDLFAARSY